MSYVSLLMLLILVHFVVDYQFQSDFVARNKNRHLNETPIPACYVMFAHASCHALPLWFLLSPPLAMAELVLHYTIDVCKCEGLTNIHVDQALHVACKVVWAWAFLYS